MKTLVKVGRYLSLDKKIVEIAYITIPGKYCVLGYYHHPEGDLIEIRYTKYGKTRKGISNKYNLDIHTYRNIYSRNIT